MFNSRLFNTKYTGRAKYIFCFKNQKFINCIPSSCRIDTAVWMHYMDANKRAGEEARRQSHKNVASNIEQVLAATPHKTPTVT